MYAQALLDSEFARWLKEGEEGESSVKEEDRRNGYATALGRLALLAGHFYGGSAGKGKGRA